jgi:acyl-CoA dehydrogenase
MSAMEADSGASLTAGLLGETLHEIFAAYSGPGPRQQAEASGWAGACWEVVADAGLQWVGVAEAAGGSGGTTLDAATVCRLVGRHGVPLPLPECGMLGGWLVAAAGLRVPDGPLSVPVPADGDELVVDAAGRLSGRLGRVPWAERVRAIAALANGPDGPRVVLVDPANAQVRPGRNLAGEPRADVRFDRLALPPEGSAPVGADVAPQLALRGALSRALLLAGAMETVSELTIEYAGQRQQFGRQIAAFQAVAQRLVLLCAETEASALATEVAARSFAELGPVAAFEVAAAKATASRAASEVAAHAHQVHGAIGMTQEYRLHHFTRRLWAWRQEWASERASAAAVGRDAVAAGAEGLWPLVSRGLVSA